MRRHEKVLRSSCLLTWMILGHLEAQTTVSLPSSANAGTNSVAIGSGAYAIPSGGTVYYGAVAIGTNSDAEVEGGIAIGGGAEATAEDCVAIGVTAAADSCPYSAAILGYTDSEHSLAVLGSATSGNYEVAIQGNADNDYAIAIGYGAAAEGTSSIALGKGAFAGGIGSCAFGLTNVSAEYSTAIGRFNLNLGKGGVAINGSSTDPVFEVGVGTSSTARANAFTVYKDGSVGVGTTNPLAVLDVAGDARISTNLTVGGTLNAAVLQVAGQSFTPGSFVQTTGSYANPAWITSLDASKLTGTLSFTALTATGGTVTGSSTAGLTLNAGGSGQNITLSPGTGGNTLINGNVGIGVTMPNTKLHVLATGFNDGAYLTNGSAWLRIEPGTAGNSSYNPLTSTGDNLIAFSSGSQNQGGLVIAPWATSMGGIKIDGVGHVGIGTRTPGSYNLAVNGTIRAKEVIVDTGWSDYVFAPDYRLAPLSEVEQHIKTEGHLPGIPSASDVAEHGVTVGEMQAKLLAKIEELTLHQIDQEKAIAALQAQNGALQREIQEMKTADSAR